MYTFVKWRFLIHCHINNYIANSRCLVHTAFFFQSFPQLFQNQNTDLIVRFVHWFGCVHRGEQIIIILVFIPIRHWYAPFSVSSFQILSLWCRKIRIAMEYNNSITCNRNGKILLMKNHAASSEVSHTLCTCRLSNEEPRLPIKFY